MAIALVLFCTLCLCTVTCAQFVAYSLSYSSTDCSGTAGIFKAHNLSTCSPGTCSRWGTGSTQGFCYTGTLQSLANPVVCPGCAYCGVVTYAAGSNCDPNAWVTSTVERLGVCVTNQIASYIIYGCDAGGNIMNLTQFSDSACTVPVLTAPARTPACVPGQPQCQFPSSPSEDVCSYTNLFTGGGGGGQNGTHGTANTHLVSFCLVVALIWAAL
jgi:hypothetical protein